MWEIFLEGVRLEVFAEEPGPVRVQVYIINGQPGLVPIYYFASLVFLTCV